MAGGSLTGELWASIEVERVLHETFLRELEVGAEALASARCSRDMSSGTLTPPRERLDRGGRGGLDDPWRVVVLNDDHNTFNGVAAALAAVIPGMTFERGLALANRIHTTGRAVVWSGHKERAEHYWAQLQERGLTMAPLER